MDIRYKILKHCTRDLSKGYYSAQLARDLRLNQKTVHNKLKQLERQNLMRTETQGKNKLFFFRKDNIKPLLLSIEAQKNIELFDTDLTHQDLFSRIRFRNTLIFGSHAQGRAKKDSDIDIFCVGKNDWKELKGFADISSIELDIHQFSEKGFIRSMQERDPFIGEVIADHVILDGFDYFTDKFIHIYYRDAFLYY